MNDFGIAEVVENGLCVGCGACAVGPGGEAAMRWTDREMHQAHLGGLSADALARASAVCPFADACPDEDALARDLWSGECLEASPEVGRYRRILAGRLADERLLVGSSSGGLTGYVLRKLLERGDVDGVVHVRSTGASGGGLVEYTVSTTPDEVLARGKSRYHSVEFSAVLNRLRGDGRRYAFVGVPCFVKAVRALCRSDPELGVQLRFFLGLVCGHMKSGAFARSFAWQMGVTPENLTEFDFRVKDPTAPASAYRVAATDARGRTVGARARDLFGSDWGHVMFRPKACDFCDDVAAETADAAFGDAWLPKYEQDWRGTNIAVVRHPAIDAILEAGREAGELVLFESGIPEFVASQAGNYRQRRDGLALRLADRRRAGLPSPAKRRFDSTGRIGFIRARIYRLRVRMGDTSHDLFAAARTAGDFEAFRAAMMPMLDRYRRWYKLMSLLGPAGPLARLLRRIGGRRNG